MCQPPRSSGQHHRDAELNEQPNVRGLACWTRGTNEVMLGQSLQEASGSQAAAWELHQQHGGAQPSQDQGAAAHVPAQALIMPQAMSSFSFLKGG